MGVVPEGVRTQERERSEPDGYCGPWCRGAVLEFGRNARMQRFLRPSYRMRAKPARARLFRFSGGDDSGRARRRFAARAPSLGAGLGVDPVRIALSAGASIPRRG